MSLIRIILLILFPLNLYSQHIVTATYYHAGPKYKLSWITASGKRINNTKLKNKQIRWVALSRDMFKYYKFGDIIKVESSNKQLNGLWVVMDKMGENRWRRIDFLTYDGETLGMKKPTKVRIWKYTY